MLWFDRISSAVRLPLNPGLLLFGIAPFPLLLLVGTWVAGIVDQTFVIGLYYFAPIVIVVGAFALFLARYLAKQTEGLVGYSATLSPDERVEGYTKLYAFAPVFVVWTLSNVLVLPIYFLTVIPSTFTLVQKILVSMAFYYWNLPLGTFIWVCLYSSYKMYKMGKRPMKLRRFTEDRTLGLRPFGRLSLRITAAIIVTISTVEIPQFVIGIASVSVLLVYAFFAGLAVVLFFLPLLPLHAKLVRTKAEELARISARYTRFIGALDGGPKVDGEMASEIVVIDKLQRDLHQIHNWPFDTGIVTRLLAILLSVSAILVSAYIRDLGHF